MTQKTIGQNFHYFVIIRCSHDSWHGVELFESRPELAENDFHVIIEKSKRKKKWNLYTKKGEKIKSYERLNWKQKDRKKWKTN